MNPRPYFFALLFLSLSVLAQNPKNATPYIVATIVFTNVENLWDTLHSADVVDETYPFTHPLHRVSKSIEEAQMYVHTHKRRADSLHKRIYIDSLIQQDDFTPLSHKNWNTDKYKSKLNRIAEVLLSIGQSGLSQSVPTIIGLIEVENEHVLSDLVTHTSLQSYPYDYAHLNSSDSRGIDVALLFLRNRFECLHVQKHRIRFSPHPPRHTREILQVSGLLDGEPFHFLINHWPSRRGGEAHSKAYRDSAGATLKIVLDSLYLHTPQHKIVVMGDFNDDPNSPSILTYLKAKDNPKRIQTNQDLFAPMYALFKQGRGTLAHKDIWHLFDQFFFSGDLLCPKHDLSTYKVLTTSIDARAELLQQEGAWKGYPKRSWEGDVFIPEGYSDHLPIYTLLIKEKK